MNRFLVIQFQFSEALYYSLIMCKQKSECTEYRITVMNGDLEKLLIGNNVIKEVDGTLHLGTSGNNLQERLKTEIAKALGKKLSIPLTSA